MHGNDDIHTSVVMPSIQLHSQVGLGCNHCSHMYATEQDWLTVNCSQKLTRPPVLLFAECTLHGISENNALKIMI